MENLDLAEVAKRVYAYRPDEAYTAQEILQIWESFGDVNAYRYHPGEVVFHAGCAAKSLGFVVSGILHLQVKNEFNEELVLGAVRPGEYIGIPRIFNQSKTHIHDVVAYEDTDVVLLPIDKLQEWRKDPTSLPFFTYLGVQLCNLLESERVRSMILSGSTITERLRRYLAYRTKKEGDSTVSVPGSLRHLADYLSVNHCAFSRVLGQLREEGVISYDRNRMTLLK